MLRVLRQPIESTLRPVIRMVNETCCFPRTHNRLFESLQRQHLKCALKPKGPPGDPPGEHIGDKRGVHKAFLRAHIRNVSHPQLVRALGFEFTLDQVWAQIRHVEVCAL